MRSSLRPLRPTRQPSARPGRPPRSRAALLGTLLGLAPLLVAAGPEAHLKPVVLEQDEYAESFTFIADLDDGTYVQLQLAVTNLGPGERTGACRALVARPDKPVWTENKRFDHDEWRHLKKPGVERLEVGPCSVESGAGTEVKVVLAEARVTLSFPKPLAPVAPPSDTLTIGKRQHRTWLLQPFTRVRAALALPGQSPLELSGGGYADHSRGNVATKSLARRWLRFRGLRGEPRVLLLARESIEGGFDPAWIWIEGSAPRPFERFSLARTGTKKAPGWTAALSGSLEAQLSSTSLLYRYAPVEELGALGWLVSPVVGSPVTYTHRAELKLQGRAPLSGILEVSLLED